VAGAPSAFLSHARQSGLSPPPSRESGASMLAHRSLRTLALFSLSALLTASACNKTKKVTSEDCERWARHFGEIMQNEADARTKSCKDGVAMSVQLGALALADKGGIATFTESCNKADATFETKQEKCFLDAKTAKEAQTCAFYPPFKDAKGDFKYMLTKLETEMGRKCQSSLDDLPPEEKKADDDEKKKSDDDDDDEPKKKKKSDDD
jgi:hypothetical protein